jgi:hypothetical protein
MMAKGCGVVDGKKSVDCGRKRSCCGKKVNRR